MPGRNLRLLFLVLVALAGLAICAPQAAAIGYWHLPGNACQWMGCGFGPGYHAPMVLGPESCCCGCCRVNEVRLPYRPCSPYDLRMASCCGCSGCGGACHCGQACGGDVQMLPAEQPVPTPSAQQPRRGAPREAFAPPMRRLPPVSPPRARSFRF